MNPDVERIVAESKAPLDVGRCAPVADTIERIEIALRRYVAFPQEKLAMLVAFWIVASHSYKAFRYCGYLALKSATPACGKSLLLEIVSLLASGRPSIETNPTAAVLYRSEVKTLILDEVDKLGNRDKEKFGEVMAVLNSGFKHDGIVRRTNKTTFKVEIFSTFGPKAFAGIERLEDALASRSFQIQMQRSAARLNRFTRRRFDTEADEVTRHLTAWSEQNEDRLRAVYDALPDEVTDLASFDHRFQDIAEPLYVVAVLADAERPAGPPLLPRLLRAFRDVAGRREVSTRERQLAALLELIEPRLQGKEDVFLETRELLELLAEREEFSFDPERGGRAFAGLMRNFDQSPRHSPTGGKRGYMLSREWVTTWRARYPTFADQGIAEGPSYASPPNVAVKALETQSGSGDLTLFDASNNGGDQSVRNPL